MGRETKSVSALLTLCSDKIWHGQRANYLATSTSPFCRLDCDGSSSRLSCFHTFLIQSILRSNITFQSPTKTIRWKDDKVILQHTTVCSASEVSLLHCSNIQSRVHQASAHTYLDPSVPSYSKWQCLEPSNPLTLLAVDYSTEILRMRIPTACLKEPVPSSVVTRPSLGTSQRSRGYFNFRAL